MHNGFVRVDNEKMSKILGNFFTIRDVLPAIRRREVGALFVVRAHYRSALQLLQRCPPGRRAPGPQALVHGVEPRNPATWSVDWSNPYAARFKAAMDEDFGTPEAVAVLFDLASEVNRKTRSAELAGLLKALAQCLGLLQGDPEAFCRRALDSTKPPFRRKLPLAQQPKPPKDFAEADRIRQALLAQGIVLKGLCSQRPGKLHSDSF